MSGEHSVPVESVQSIATELRLVDCLHPAHLALSHVCSPNSELSTCPLPLQSAPFPPPLLLLPNRLPLRDMLALHAARDDLNVVRYAFSQPVDAVLGAQSEDDTAGAAPVDLIRPGSAPWQAGLRALGSVASRCTVRSVQYRASLQARDDLIRQLQRHFAGGVPLPDPFGRLAPMQQRWRGQGRQCYPVVVKRNDTWMLVLGVRAAPTRRPQELVERLTQLVLAVC
jgi:hypothetical protein